MKRTKSDIYLAIPMPSDEPFEGDTQRSRTALYEMLDELCALSGKLDFSLAEYGIYRPTIELLKGKTRNKKQLEKWFEPKLLKSCEILKVSVEGDVGDDEMLADAALQIYFPKRVSDLLVIANLCSLGSIELQSSMVIHNRTRLKYKHIPQLDAWALQRAARMALKISWPKLQKLDFAQAWQWINKRIDFLDSFSGSPTGRAINAFSHLLEKSTADEPMQLVWALIGIESLYVNGKVSIMEQVREKVQSFLGKQETYKKKIVEMYNFRSRFVHGDLDFPDLHFIADALPASRRFDKELLESIDIAVSILAATLQEIIQRDWNGVSFMYQVRDSSV